MTREHVLESHEIKLVLQATHRDVTDWPWWFFVSVVFGTLILLIVLLWSI